MTCTQCNGAGFYTLGNWPHKYTCPRCLSGTHYAGIGSRETPVEILAQMKTLGAMLAIKGFTLRSGCAKGADSAFEAGAKSVGGRVLLRTASPMPQWLEHAASYHPAWDKCDDKARALHARNSAIMLGDALDQPVSFVACWTPEGAVTGGTGQALRIAAAHSIPVFNLFWSTHYDALVEYLR